MRPWQTEKWGSLSARIKLLVLVAVLPGVALVVYQARTSRADAIAAAEDHARRTALSLTRSQQTLIDSTRQFLQTLAATPEAQQPADAACPAYLAELLSLNAVYANLGIPLADGRLLCSALPLAKAVNVADRPYFRRAVTSREFSISQFQLDRATQQSSVNFAYPVVEPNSRRVLGAAVAVMSLQWWSQRLADLDLPDGAVARVLDAKGTVVARFPPEPTELGQPLEDGELHSARLLTSQPGTLYYQSQNGGQQLMVFGPLLEHDGKPVATMGLAVPLDGLHAEADRRMYMHLAYLLAGLLLAFVLAHQFIQRGIAQPLRRLLNAIDDLGQGRSVVLAPSSSAVELRELAVHFNQMASQRQNVEAQLRVSEDNLRITLASIGDAVIATNLQGRVTQMNAVAEALTGWPIDQAMGQPLSEVFRVVHTRTGQSVQDPVNEALRRGKTQGLAHTTALLSRDGSEYQISENATPIRDSAGQMVGTVLVFSNVSEPFHVRQQLANSEARFRTLTLLSSDWYWEQDRAFRFVVVDGKPSETRGMATPQLGKTPWDTGNTLVADQWRGLYEALHRHEEFRDFEMQRTDMDGQMLWAAVSGTPVFDTEGRFTGYRGVGRDISARKRDEHELRIAAAAFETQEGMVVTSRQRLILRCNAAFTRISGYTQEEAIGKTTFALLSVPGHYPPEFYQAMTDRVNTTGQWDGELWSRRKSGEIRLFHVTLSEVKHASGTLTRYVISLTDVTQKVAAAKEIEHLAFYDPLTQLPNRRLLMDRLQQALASSARSEKYGALLCLDLDHFKTLNDTLGHDVGDLLLQQVAQRLKGCVREGDTVARFGGDEFLVLLEDLHSQPTEAAELAQHVGTKILAALNTPYLLAAHQVHSTPSVGAALFISHQQNMDELLKHADLAMYAAKTSGRNAIRFFDPKMQATVTARAALENDLRDALAQRQFQLYYQVQMHQGQTPVGAEVLIRWVHPERGLVGPLEFIPLAEETGLIVPIGLWVLQTACAQVRRWQNSPALASLQLAVNVSARQFRQPDFVQQVYTVLAQTGARSDRIKLELTESVALDNVPDTIEKMHALQALGLHFSMDDFGTGQSSLSYLSRLPLDQLKIDQSFVRNIGIHEADSLIVQTIIGMAHSLGIDVIAEGVETEAQRAFLEQHGCTLCQGYLFSKPVPLYEFERKMTQGL